MNFPIQIIFDETNQMGVSSTCTTSVTLLVDRAIGVRVEHLPAGTGIKEFTLAGWLARGLPKMRLTTEPLQRFSPGEHY